MKQTSIKKGRLRIKISNLQSQKGVLNVAIANEENRLFESPYKQEIFPFVFLVNDELYIDDLPFGTYAIRVFHDENCNGEIDLTNFGFSKELVGYSMAKKRVASVPDFDSSQFMFAETDQVIEISMTK